MEPRWTDDDELLAELSAALAEADVPPEVATAGQLAWSLRDLDGELATLVYDSAADGRLAAASRSAAPARTLVFGVAGLSVELEVSGPDLYGQLVPGGPGHVEAVGATGAVFPTAVDEVGRFVLRDVTGGLLRLRCRGAAGAELSTGWVRLAG